MDRSTRAAARAYHDLAADAAAGYGKPHLYSESRTDQGTLRRTVKTNMEI